MNATYTLTEGNDALNRVLLMMRYDLGKTLDENIVLEQPEEKFDTPYNKALMRKYQPKAKEMTVESFFEGFRDALYSPGGIAIETFLTSTGLGSVGVISSYITLLIYDIYLSISNNDTNWLNIIFDLLGILTSGALSGLLAPIFKGVGKGFTTIEGALMALKNSKYWGKISPVLLKIGDSIGMITSKISEMIKWIVESLGPKVPSFIKTGANKIISFLKDIPQNILNFFKKIGTKTGNVLKKMAKPGQATLKQGVKHGVTAGVVAKGIETGVHKGTEMYQKYKTNKQKTQIKDIGDTMSQEDIDQLNYTP
jgi:hypothetical protein